MHHRLNYIEEMEIATEGAPSTSGDTSSVTNGRSRRRWGIGLASVLLLAGLVAIIAVFAGKANKKVKKLKMKDRRASL